MKKILSFSNIALFIVATIAAIIAAIVVVKCGGDKTSAVLTGAAVGIVGTMIVGGIANACKWEIDHSPVAGVIGTLVGTVAVYLFI